MVDSSSFDSRDSAASVLRRPDAGWFLTVYPLAGEAGGSFVPSVRPVRSSVPGTPAADPVRSRAEAQRRARSKVRRYCAEHRLNRFGTLTYAGAGCHDPAQLRRDVADFFRALRRERGVGPFPYVWVPEWHKTDHGLHVHFALGGFVHHGIIERAWGRGFVNIKRISDLRVGSGAREEARVAARYLSKYVSKSFGDDESSRALGLHRYEVAEGFQPRRVRLQGDSLEDLVAAAVRMMGAHPDRFWTSNDSEDWQGPPALWMAWA